jgi:hypothetical protein
VDYRCFAERQYDYYREASGRSRDGRRHELSIPRHAWVAVQVLAEKEMSPPWELHSGTTLEWLRCETEQPVDDLMVGTSEGGLIFSQVKHTLQLSASASSDLASALDQCVR